MKLLTILFLSLLGNQLKYTDLHKGNFSSYLSRDGKVYELGDTLIVGEPSSNVSFDFLFISVVGKGVLKTTQDALNMPIHGANPLSEMYKGYRCTIIKIALAGSKRQGYYCNLYCQGTLDHAEMTYIVKIEKAVYSGEIK
jgi:hypothetical protein